MLYGRTAFSLRGISFSNFSFLCSVMGVIFYPHGGRGEGISDIVCGKHMAA